jgi:hypothetical protein
MTERINAVTDPWQHRSSGMKCRTCMWFAAKTTRQVQVDRKVVGRCRKSAPTMDGYPVVFLDDWCGSHKLDENKI